MPFLIFSYTEILTYTMWDDQQTTCNGWWWLLWILFGWPSFIYYCLPEESVRMKIYSSHFWLSSCAIAPEDLEWLLFFFLFVNFFQWMEVYHRWSIDHKSPQNGVQRTLICFVKLSWNFKDSLAGSWSVLASRGSEWVNLGQYW